MLKNSYKKLKYGTYFQTLPHGVIQFFLCIYTTKEPQTNVITNKALKIKARSTKRPAKKLKSAALVVPIEPNGDPYHAENTFINQQEIGGEVDEPGEVNKPQMSQPKNTSDPYIMFSLASEDGGVSLEGRNITQL